MHKAILFLALLVCAPGFAGVLYDQPLVNGTDGGPFSNDPTQLFANLFSIAGGGVINQAVWYGAAEANLPFSNFNVEFYADTAGSPGAQLAIFTGTPTLVDQGVKDSYGAELFQFTMNFAGFTASPGTNYFFSASDSGSENFVWALSNLTGHAKFSTSGAAGPWNVDPSRQSNAFTLLNSAGTVPEPGTLMLVVAGLAGVASARRRKTAR